MRANTREFTIGLACALSVVVLWSSFHLISRVAVQTSLTPYDLVTLRVGVGGIIMLPVLLRLGLGHLRLWQAIILAVVAGPGFALPAFTGYQFAPAAHGAAILAGALPLFTVPIAWLVLGEHLNIRRLLGLLALLAGVVFLLGDSFTGFGNGQWRGDALFVVGAIDWSIFAVLARAWRVEPVRGTALVAVISLIGYVPLHFAFLPSKFDTAPFIDIAGQAVYQGFLSMIISLLLFTRAVGALGASLTTMITASVPVTAALAAFVILGEPLTVFSVVAIVLVTIGMFGAVSGGRALRPAQTPVPAPAPTGEKAQ
jgi:drug/metabolite transporter (DMT)-like permease